MLHSFFQFSNKVLEVIYLFAFFEFYPVASRNGKVHYSASFLFLLAITRSGRLAEIKWSISLSKSQRNLCVSFSRTDSWLCKYHVFVWSNLNFLNYSQWMSFPPSRVWSYTQFVLIYCIRLLCDWSFRLSHFITYSFYIVASYLFLL